MNLLVYRFFVCFLRKKMFTLPSFKKKLKDKKNRGGWFKRSFLSLGKRAAFGHVLLFSTPVLNQRAWFSGNQFPVKKNLVVSYRKKKTPTFSTDITYCSVQEFSLPKKKEKKEEKKAL